MGDVDGGGGGGLLSLLPSSQALEEDMAQELLWPVGSMKLMGLLRT